MRRKRRGMSQRSSARAGNSRANTTIKGTQAAAETPVRARPTASGPTDRPHHHDHCAGSSHEDAADKIRLVAAGRIRDHAERNPQQRHPQAVHGEYHANRGQAGGASRDVGGKGRHVGVECAEKQQGSGEQRSDCSSVHEGPEKQTISSAVERLARRPGLSPAKGAVLPRWHSLPPTPGPARRPGRQS